MSLRGVALRFAVAGCAWLLTMQPAVAAAPSYSRDYETCADTSEGVTGTILDCIAREHARQDRRLNQAYRATLAALPAARRRALTAAQRAWLGFRDAECAYVGDPEGGQAADIARNECVLRMTAERADALDAERRAARDLYGAP